MKIGKELALIAREKGICQERSDRTKALDDKNRLPEVYAHGIDFCFPNNFPTNDYIREDFVGRMEEYGMHLDESLNMANNRRVVALGHCIGWVEINNSDVSETFVKHESDLITIVEGNPFAMIDMFDDSKLHVVALADSRVCTNHYGGILKTEFSEGAVIKVIEKYKKAY